MIGSVHEDFLNSICYNVPEELRSKLIGKISCKWNEMVPFAVFKYSVTVALVLQGIGNSRYSPIQNLQQRRWN